MKYLKYLYLAVLSVTLLSCFKDIGNYNYNNYPEIKIEGLEKSYSAISYSTILKIDPTIENAENYDYLWVVYNSSDYTGKFDTLSFERELNKQINLPKGSYKLSLEVTDKKTKYREVRQTDLLVTTAFSDGFYVFKEIDGMSDADLYGSETTTKDILLNKYGSRMEGKAVNLSILASYSYIDDVTFKPIMYIPMICAITDKQCYMINLSSFDIVFNLDNMFYDKPDVVTPLFFGQHSSSFCVFVTKEGFYNIDGMSVPGGGYGLPTSDALGTLDLSKYSLADESSYSIYYDNKKEGFILTTYNGGANYCNYEESDLYKPVNMGVKMKYLGRYGAANRSNSKGFAIMESKVDRQLFIYPLHIKGSGNPIIQEEGSVYEIKSDSEIYNATIFGSHYSEAPYIYYSSGDNNVYAYDCISRQDINIVSLPAGEEVTYVRNLYWNNSVNPEENFDYFIIATHNAGKYKVYMYETVGGRPHPDKTPKIIEGDGKVVAMQFASSHMSRFNSGFKLYPFN